MASPGLWDLILHSLPILPPCLPVPGLTVGRFHWLSCYSGSCQVCFCLRALALQILSAGSVLYFDPPVCSYSSFKHQFQFQILKRLPVTTVSKFKMIFCSISLISLRSFIEFCNYVICFIYWCTVLLLHWTIRSTKARLLCSCLLLYSTA